MKALILAGGRGSRLDEFTKDKNKCLLEVYGKTLLEYNLDRAVEAGVKEIIIVVGYKKEEVKKRVGRNYKGVHVNYIPISEEKIKEGLVTGIEVARENIGKSDFMLMLADEVMVNADLVGMLKKFQREELFGICGVVYEPDKSSIKRTYSIMGNHTGRIFRLIEKPRFPINNLKGTGHCIFRNEILDYIDKTPINTYRNQKEIVDMMQCAIDDGKNVKVYKIADGYVNINNYEDLNMAREMIKTNNPRVLIVHNQMKYYGGGELVVVELANWLTKKGIKNDILALSSSKEVERQLLNTEVIIPKNDIDLNPPGYKNMQDILKAIKVFRGKLKEIKENYDVVNFHDFPVTWSLWPSRKPAVWFMNNPPNLYSRPDAGIFLKTLNKFRIWIDKFIVRHSIDIITVAEVLNKKRALERYKMDAKLIDFGINYDFFSKGNAQKARRKFNLKDRFVIVQSGMICNPKNQFASVKAVERIKDKIPNVLLVLTGKPDPDYKKKIEGYIKEKKLEKYVLFIGMFDKKEELADLYKASNIGLYPIRKQGGVLAPLEAVCAGVPIIVSEEMETAPLIKKNKLGVVTSDYAKTIMDIYRNQEEFKDRTKDAMKFIKDNLSWEEFTNKMIKTYRESWKKYS